eukprot:TRINITY_DN997_c0_g1_i3.p1 TRINITY_DN997_c0_g1~~TRINITY_DN997_c0_g1_i3.p1  ORF type:complete len:547 (-),score=176.90 TRINITY_DN997_c0_g1_i3:804-2273(-)
MELAVSAFGQFTNTFYPELNAGIRKRVVTGYCDVVLNDPNPAATRGYVSALGNLPVHIAGPCFDEILSALVKATEIQENPDDRDAETRRNAINAIVKLCELTNMGNSNTSQQNVDIVFQVLMRSCQDYSVDKRGDIGSWVREASMVGMQSLVNVLLTNQQQQESSDDQGAGFLTKEMVNGVFCSLLQQLVEKIDRIRAKAGEVFFELLHREPAVPFVSDRELMEQVFPKNEIINWAAPKDTYHRAVQLLDADAFRKCLLSGLVISAGGLTESSVKGASQSLTRYLKNAHKNGEDEKIVQVAETLVSVFEDHWEDKRVVVPMFKTLQTLLSHQCFKELTPEKHSFAVDVLTLTKKTVNLDKDIMKIMGCVPVLANLMILEDPARTNALKTLLSLVGMKYPRVRKLVAEQMYESLLINDDCMEEEVIEQVMDVLSETDWDGKQDVVKAARMQLYDLLAIEPPKPKAKSTVQSNSNAAGEDDYSSLVKEMGY